MITQNKVLSKNMSKLVFSLFLALAMIVISGKRSLSLPLKPIFYQMGVNAVNDLLTKQSTNQETTTTQQVADATGAYPSGDQNYQNQPIYQQYPPQQPYQNQPIYQQYPPQQPYQNQPIYPQAYPNYPPQIYLIPMYPPQRSSPPVIINNF